MSTNEQTFPMGIRGDKSQAKKKGKFKVQDTNAPMIV